MSKTILITGSTDGIGKLAAIRLAKAGHQVLVHGRNQDKLTATIAEIKQLAKHERVQGFVADFSDLTAVTTMAEQVLEVAPDLDILINNAGVFKSPVEKNKAGWDLRFVVNYFAPFLLTEKLLPVLRRNTSSRILNLSSAAQLPISYEALRGQQTISTRDAYAQSKLALTMWSFDLAKREPEIQVQAINPGSLLNTNMVKEAFGQFWSPAEKGGDILFELAMAKDGENASGQYYDNDRGAFGPAHSDAYDAQKITKLLLTTKTILGL